ncbi:MAG: hypothetical protein Q9173_000512 [Seirophora scorigena]
MGKSKKQRLSRTPHVPYDKKIKLKGPHTTTQRTSQLPFTPTDRILLLGEGDFSFSRSLYIHHDCRSLVATCYDSVAALAEKHPQSSECIHDLQEAARQDASVVEIKILYGVDATKLGKSLPAGGGKLVKKGGFDRVMFNFPHVGGLTKDVNRQVRYNQGSPSVIVRFHAHGLTGGTELLVGFFKAATPLLTPAGTILVTIFEGEPYSLWNIRDLARHVGLQVGRSFKFHAEAYQGYRHARTLGNIEGGRGWKGEDRDARTYVFERKDMEKTQTQQAKRMNSDSDEND